MYCGVDVVLREQEQVQKATVANLFVLARTAEESKNSAEAYKYYSAILEHDPANMEAWVGKGLAAGWQSTLVAARFQETKACLQRAIELGLRESNLCERTIDELEKLVLAFHMRALKQSSNDSSAFIRRIGLALELLTICRDLKPRESSASWVVTLHKTLGIYGASATGAPAELLNSCRKFLEQNAPEKLKRLSEQYKPEESVDFPPSTGQPQAKKGVCFVATAALGDCEHPFVVVLRQFRDECLAATFCGRAFLRWYERRGPVLAGLIRGRRIPRFLSCWLVVLPSYLVARVILMKRDSAREHA